MAPRKGKRKKASIARPCVDHYEREGKGRRCSGRIASGGKRKDPYTTPADNAALSKKRKKMGDSRSLLTEERGGKRREQLAQVRKEKGKGGKGLHVDDTG